MPKSSPVQLDNPKFVSFRAEAVTIKRAKQFALDHELDVGEVYRRALDHYLGIDAESFATEVR